MTYTTKEIKKISTNFRNVASRLLRTNYNDGILNLKKFLNFIDKTPIVKNFIESKKTKDYPMDEIIKSTQETTNEYVIPVDDDEEISYVYQFLKYTVENCEFYYYPISYGYGSKMQEIVDNFNKRVISPYISHITAYLNEILIDISEENNMVGNQYNFNASTQFNSADNNSKITAKQINNNQNEKIIDQLIELISELNNPKLKIPEKSDLIEIIETTKEQLQSNKPKRSIINIAINKISELTKFGAASAVLIDKASEIKDSLELLLSSI